MSRDEVGKGEGLAWESTPLHHCTTAPVVLPACSFDWSKATILGNQSSEGESWTVSGMWAR